MSGTKEDADSPVVSVEEDPNAAIVCSSPPCFMHELDPSYLGYLGPDEVFALLDALLAADWGGIVPDEAGLRARLGRHLGAAGRRPDRAPDLRGGAATSGDPGEPCDRGPDRLAGLIREALPRTHDDALRGDLKEVLDAFERGLPRCEARPDTG